MNDEQTEKRRERGQTGENSRWFFFCIAAFITLCALVYYMYSTRITLVRRVKRFHLLPPAIYFGLQIISLPLVPYQIQCPLAKVALPSQCPRFASVMCHAMQTHANTENNAPPQDHCCFAPSDRVATLPYDIDGVLARQRRVIKAALPQGRDTSIQHMVDDEQCQHREHENDLDKRTHDDEVYVLCVGVNVRTPESLSVSTFRISYISYAKKRALEACLSLLHKEVPTRKQGVASEATLSLGPTKDHNSKIITSTCFAQRQFSAVLGVTCEQIAISAMRRF
ncbi:hypothetical protein EDD21DRAFT_79127 [Dissophora ornata]|nr:hypothetical protein EDD21DRAFT_79127 [Dissophora ornata]